MSLRHIAPVFRVTDLARSLAFYRDRLGFRVEFVYDNFYADVCRDGCHIHLNCAPPAPRDQAAFERASSTIARPRSLPPAALLPNGPSYWSCA